MSFVNLEKVEEKEIVPGFRARFVHSTNNTMAFWRVEEGAALPEHSHPHEQMTTVLEGTFELTVGEVTKRIRSGEVVVVPPDVKHTGKALTTCRLLDVFYPVRQEYK